MAVYKIFPEKDSTIYSKYPNKNTGLDEILEASTYFDISGNPQVSRFLIQFPQSEITDTFSTYIGNLTWSASLKCFLAYASGLNSDTTMEIYPISGSWNMGTGRYAYTPEYTNGVGWYSRLSAGVGNWSTSSFANFVTASYSSSISGGGTWYTGSSNTTVLPIFTTQSFSFYDNKDINIDITNIVKAWVSGTFSNNGVIIKQQTEFVNNSDYQTKLQYFSRDTHTIYPPQLELKWDDSSTIPFQSVLETLPAIISISNNPGIFYPSSINEFRVNSRPEYPVRTFQTSSYYTQNYGLPYGDSYYAIKDLDTNEYVIDFDDQYTKLSLDDNGSFFTLYMNGLEPERYYSILIKTTINGSTIIFDDNYYFKIING